MSIVFAGHVSSGHGTTGAETKHNLLSCINF
jgi:hypothetical protein